MRALASMLLAGSFVFGHAADLFYEKDEQLYRYDTVMMTTSAAFGGGYGVGASSFGSGPFSGLEVGPDGTIYAEALIGSVFGGQHLLQKFDGKTGAYLGGFNYTGGGTPSLGPDGFLYSTASAAFPIESGGFGGGPGTAYYFNGLQRIDPATGASSVFVAAGPDSPLYSSSWAIWVGGDMFVNDGSGLPKRFDPVTGAYKGQFWGANPGFGSTELNGIVYANNYADQQVTMYRASDGAPLGNLLKGPLRGYTGRIEIADGKLFAAQIDPATFLPKLNQYDLLTGEYELTVPTGFTFQNFAVAPTYAPVPEPGMFAALGLGAVALLRRRKRA